MQEERGKRAYVSLATASLLRALFVADPVILLLSLFVEGVSDPTFLSFSFSLALPFSRSLSLMENLTRIKYHHNLKK